MKRSKKPYRWVILGIIVLFSASCINLDSVVRDVGGLIADSQGGRDSSGSTKAEPSGGNTGDGGDGGGNKAEPSGSGGDGGGLFGQMLMGATGMTAMQDYMIAMTVYANAFFAGGYAYGYDDFAEGEGVVWRIVTHDSGESSEMTVERALLKQEADGAWWMLAYESDGDRFMSEAFIGPDYELLVFRYEDPDQKQIREWRAEETGDQKTVERTETESTGEESQPEFFAGDYGAYVVGTETVSVRGGRFSAEHIKIAEPYADGSGELAYEWWLAEDAPGRLVKYDWSDSAQDSGITGELVEIRRDYRTRLGSY